MKTGKVRKKLRNDKFLNKQQVIDVINNYLQYTSKTVFVDSAGYYSLKPVMCKDGLDIDCIRIPG